MSRVTEGQSVRVMDAWVEDAVAFCVVYRYPYFDGLLGIRRAFDEDMYGEVPSDPGQFGRDVADFDIGEPLGSVVERLRVDSAGVHWWGDLEEDLPCAPDNATVVTDAWGDALTDYLDDRFAGELLLEDRDGNVWPAMQPDSFFRTEPDWEPEERQLVAMVREGPVLDLGAGAGRVSLHLQARGLPVTAVESSRGAADVCRRRGVRDVRMHDLNEPPSDQAWMTVLLLCGNLGLGGSWDGNKRLLKRLAEVCAPGALLLADSVNYSGSGVVELRIRYGNRVTPWWQQRNVAASEVASLVDSTGWRVERHVEAANGVDHYLLLALI